MLKNTVSEDKEDYVTAVAGRGNPTATLSLVCSKKLIFSLQWEIKVNRNQDVCWAYSICAKREFKSIYYPKSAGAWVEHGGERISEGHLPQLIAKEDAEQLLKLSKTLQQQRRLTEQRAKAISITLWQRVHKGTMYAPFYWFRIAQKTERIMPRQFPRTAMYSNVYIRKINPFWVELAIAPFRWLRILFGHKYTV